MKYICLKTDTDCGLYPQSECFNICDTREEAIQSIIDSVTEDMDADEQFLYLCSKIERDLSSESGIFLDYDTNITYQIVTYNNNKA